MPPAAQVSPELKARAAALASQQRPAKDRLAGTAAGELLDDLASYHDDFVGFVQWAFPWGEEGTMLEGMSGPEDWQREQQERISDAVREGGAEGCVVQEDVASGHGVGKSAQVSWAILWAISTAADTRGVVTANTDTQLRTKTWADFPTPCPEATSSCTTQPSAPPSRTASLMRSCCSRCQSSGPDMPSSIVPSSPHGKAHRTKPTKSSW